VLLGAAIPGAPHAASCGLFCTDLIEHGSTVYFSQIVHVELPQAFRRLATTTANLPADVRQTYSLDDWGRNPAVRSGWLEVGRTEVERLLTGFYRVIELPWRRSIWEVSPTLMARYSLQSLDATHVATAVAYELRDLATVDDAYRRVSELRLHLIRDPAGR
jgi:predicted nucleic acid-binding protein